MAASCPVIPARTRRSLGENDLLREAKKVACELPPDNRPIFVWSPATDWQNGDGRRATTEIGIEPGPLNPQTAEGFAGAQRDVSGHVALRPQDRAAHAMSIFNDSDTAAYLIGQRMPLFLKEIAQAESVTDRPSGKLRRRRNMIGRMNEEIGDAGSYLVDREPFGTKAQRNEKRGVMFPVKQVKADVVRNIFRAIRSHSRGDLLLDFG